MKYVGLKTSANTIDFYPKYKKGGWPLGTVYIQFPGEATPADLLGGTWTNISSSYAGRFFRTSDGYYFRAEGGAACAFNGNNQTANIYVNVTYTLNSAGSHTHNYTRAASCGSCACGGGAALNRCTCYYNSCPSYTWSHTHSITKTSCSCCHSSESRPTNYTIRIWEKTGW